MNQRYGYGPRAEDFPFRNIVTTIWTAGDIVEVGFWFFWSVLKSILNFNTVRIFFKYCVYRLVGVSRQTMEAATPTGKFKKSHTGQCQASV